MWFPPRGGSDVTDPPWGGSNRMMGVFRSWGGWLDTLIITYSLGLSVRDFACLRAIRSREVMPEVDREVMGLGVSRVCKGGLGRNSVNRTSKRNLGRKSRHLGRYWAHESKFWVGKPYE
jgi:hypothetical protein